MVQAGVDIINAHSAVSIERLLPVLQKYMTSTDPRLREGVVVLLGAVGRHLPHNSPMVLSFLFLLPVVPVLTRVCLHVCR